MSTLENILSKFPDRVSSGKQAHIFTPAHIAKEMINALPEDIWNKHTTFLDICCKSGIFLYEIYQKLMDSREMQKDFPDKQSRREHILNNQLFGIAPDQFCQLQSARAIYGYMENNSHIIDFGNNYNTVMQNTDKTFLLERLRKEFNKVNFDVVIGNPPYNKGMDLDFVDLGYKLSRDKVCMITPAKWQTTEADQKVASKNMNYGEFREKIVPHMVQVNFYPDSYDIFNAELTGGVTYFILDKDMHTEAKVVNSSKLQPLINSEETRTILNEQSLYNMGNKIIEHVKNYPKFHFKNEKNRYQVWTNSQFNIGGGHRKSGSGASDGGGNGGYLFSLAGNLLVTSTSRLLDSTIEKSTVGASKCAFSSDNKKECESFISWINTKFVRFLIMINASKLTGILTDYYFRFVPAPPSGKFDHIYTDDELYKAFNLPQEYIDVIEAVIKERK